MSGAGQQDLLPQYFFSGDQHCYYYQETVSRKLNSSTVLLEGLLDALLRDALVFRLVGLCAVWVRRDGSEFRCGGSAA